MGSILILPFASLKQSYQTRAAKRLKRKNDTARIREWLAFTAQHKEEQWVDEEIEAYFLENSITLVDRNLDEEGKMEGKIGEKGERNAGANASGAGGGGLLTVVGGALSNLRLSPKSVGTRSRGGNSSVGGPLSPRSPIAPSMVLSSPPETPRFPHSPLNSMHHQRDVEVPREVAVM
ncbi:hypothetical protein ABW19_dt0206815 [Dactylella cylindrospora]|nr:hypothetical protein ABW19_dt0206815 [Dactylella cylindrospora]